MKCEMCHQKDAETAILLAQDGEEQELYICRECANRERVRRQQKSQRTRKTAIQRPGRLGLRILGVVSGRTAGRGGDDHSGRFSDRRSDSEWTLALCFRRERDVCGYLANACLLLKLMAAY
jgi:hypothetical protein